MNKLAIVMVLTLAAIAPAARAADTKAPDVIAKLEIQGRIDPLAVRATPDGKYVIVPSVVPPAKQDGEPTFLCTLIDTATGRQVNLADWLDDAHKKAGWQIAAAKPSWDGKFLLASGKLAGPTRVTAAVFVADMEGRKLRLIDQGALSMAAWVGPRAAVASADAKGNIAPIKFYNPATDRWGESKIVGLPAAGDANGTMLAIGCNAASPMSPLTMKDFDAASTVLMEPNGNVLHNLGTNREVATPPILSAGGRLAAWQHNGWKGADPNGPPSVIRIDILDTQDGKRRQIDEDCIPLSIGDGGQVLAITSEGDADGATLRWFDAAGKGTTLSENAWCGLAAAGRIYYIAGKQTEPLTLRVMEQPK